MKKKIIIGIIAVLALVCLLSSIYTVEENQYACTVRFSKIIHTTETPGLHFKVPFLDSGKNRIHNQIGIKVFESCGQKYFLVTFK